MGNLVCKLTVVEGPCKLHSIMQGRYVWSYSCFEWNLPVKDNAFSERDNEVKFSDSSDIDDMPFYLNQTVNEAF